jgi:hypothetical protein
MLLSTTLAIYWKNLPPEAENVKIIKGEKSP